MMQSLYNLFYHREEVPVVHVGDNLLQIIASQEKLAQAAAWLNENHPGRYMVWNLMHDMKREGVQIAAEVSALFGDNVHDIAASVGPPVLEDILRLCHSVQRWTHAEEHNVAVLLTNTKAEVEEYATLLATAYALYAGWHPTVQSALKARQERLQELQLSAIDLLLNPEEEAGAEAGALAVGRQPVRAYLHYIHHLIHTPLPPRPSALHITRVVMHGIPRVGGGWAGVRPVLTVRSARTGRLAFSSLWADPRPPSLTQDALSHIFLLDQPFAGDMVLEIFHMGAPPPAKGRQQRRQAAAAAAEEAEAAVEEDEQGGWGLVASLAFHTALAWTHACTPAPAPHPDPGLRSGVLRVGLGELGVGEGWVTVEEDFTLDLLCQEVPAQGREEGLARLVQAMPARARSPQGPAVARAALRVTPSPWELLGEDQATGETLNVSSVPVRYSFPPVHDPFDPEGECKTLVVGAEEARGAETLPLDEAGEEWGRGVGGLCMLLPSLLVLEPWKSDPVAQGLGLARAQLRLPIEHLTSLALAPARPPPPLPPHRLPSPDRREGAGGSEKGVGAGGQGQKKLQHSLSSPADLMHPLMHPAGRRDDDHQHQGGGRGAEGAGGESMTLEREEREELEEVVGRVRAGAAVARQGAPPELVLRLTWRCGAATRSVVIGESGQRAHVRELAEQISAAQALLHHRLRQAVGERGAGEEEWGRVEEEVPVELAPPEAPDLALSLPLARALRRHLPSRVRLCAHWRLLYATAKHGASLGTFFRQTGWEAPTLLVIKDADQRIFGAFASAPWEAHLSYFGTGESFVWKWEGGGKEEEAAGVEVATGVEVFGWGQGEGYNCMFQLARNGEGIAVGGGSSHAISLDPEFLHGTSGPSETFRSPQLAGKGRFECLCFEVWAFHH